MLMKNMFYSGPLLENPGFKALKLVLPAEENTVAKFYH